MPSWRPLRALYSPDSYALVLLLILVTYALSTALTEAWATSLIVAVQIGVVWVTLRAARARRSTLVLANVALGVAALAVITNLVVNYQFHTDSVVAWVSCALYLAAPVAIVRHLLRRRTIDAETVMGAIAAYLMAGMFFAFLYRAIGIVQPHPAVLRRPGSWHVLAGPVLLVHHPHHHRLRRPDPGRQPGPVVRGAGDADRPAVPDHRGRQGRQQLAAGAGPERAAGEARRRVTPASAVRFRRHVR